jgi:thiol-disulfide isomerase/thioredoxin
MQKKFFARFNSFNLFEFNKYILLIIIVFLFVGCGKNAKINGCMKNVSNEKLTYYREHQIYPDEYHSIDISQTGEFHITLNDAEKEFIIIPFKKETAGFYVEKDTKITISGDMNSGNSFIFEGSTAEESMTFTSFLKIQKEILESSNGSLSEGIQTFEKNFHMILNNYKKHNNNEIFIKLLTLKYNYFREWVVENYLLTKKSAGSRYVQEQTDKHIAKLDINRQDESPELLVLSEFRTYLTIRLALLSNNIKYTDKDSCDSVIIEKSKIINNHFKGKIKDYLLTSMICESMRYQKVNMNVVNKIMNDVDNKKFKEEIQKTVSDMAKLEKGKPAPAFKFEDQYGKMRTLTEFRGKYTVIDIWASWCSPCLHEIPYIKKLAEKYKNNNIVFIGISVDEDKDVWRNIIKEKELDGIQLNTGGWDVTFMKNYNIIGIPHFIVIDKEGNIVLSNAQSPSEGLDNDIKNIPGL